MCWIPPRPSQKEDKFQESKIVDKLVYIVFQRRLKKSLKEKICVLKKEEIRVTL